MIRMTRQNASPGPFWVLAITLIAAVYAGLVAWTGGFNARIGDWHLRSRAWDRPAVIAVLGAAWLAYHWRTRIGEALANAWAVADTTPASRVLAGAAVAWTLA